jgi:hypothetical protein
MDVCGGRIVGIAKGAGMIEPNMATMLSYILTGKAQYLGYGVAARWSDEWRVCCP